MKTNTLTAARETAAKISRRLDVGKATDWVTVDGIDYGYFLMNGRDIVKTFKSRKEQCEYLNTVAAACGK